MNNTLNADAGDSLSDSNVVNDTAIIEKPYIEHADPVPIASDTLPSSPPPSPPQPLTGPTKHGATTSKREQKKKRGAKPDPEETLVRAPVSPAALSINDLPAELLIDVFANLELVQLNSLRLVCKRWNFVVLDQATWQRAFAKLFGAPARFPSLLKLSNWMGEYYDRVKGLKTWTKARLTHMLYLLINNELRNIDLAMVDFTVNGGCGRLLTFSKMFGHVSRCNATNGRNQGYLPGLFSETHNILAYDWNWNWLVMGVRGSLVVRNLNAVATRGSATSVVREDTLNEFITAVALNPVNHSSRTPPDVVIGTSRGTVEWWNLSGKMLAEIQVTEAVPGDKGPEPSSYPSNSEPTPVPVLHLKSDFSKFVIVQTPSEVVILDFHTHKEVVRFKLPCLVEYSTQSFAGYSPLWYFGLRVDHSLNDFIVDWVGCNVIFAYNTHLKVYNFSDPDDVYEKDVDIGSPVVRTQLQVHSGGRTNSVDLSVVGGDGLFCANILANGQVIVWNVRAFDRHIAPLYTLSSIHFGKHLPEIDPSIGPLTLVALNSMVLCVGGYNGFFNVYNVFTGELIKQLALAKYPRKFSHMYNQLVPINQILLDPSHQTACHGVVVLGDTIQFFEFGDDSARKHQQMKEAQKKKAPVARDTLKAQQILDGIHDYDMEVERKQRAIRLLDKYNGDAFEDADEEMSMALALSQSEARPIEEEDDELRRAIEESERMCAVPTEVQAHEGSSRDMQAPEADNETWDIGEPWSDDYAPHGTTLDVGHQPELDEDEQLRRALELSLVDQ